MLQNLHELGAQLQEAYVKNYPVKDKALPAVFKQLVKEIDGATIEYNEYSFVVTITSSAQKIFFPNQLLYVAACFADYYKALSEYAQIIKMDLRISDNDIKQAKDNKEFSQKVLSNAILEDGDRELLVQFLSNYNWWFGGKGIERADFYISPILSLSKLVNASQSYVADLCKYLARNDQALKALKDEISSVNSDNISRQIIYFGASGTGKSHEVAKTTKQVEAETKANHEAERVFRTTFHPDSDYSTFVGCYKPTMQPEPQTYVVEGQEKPVIGMDGKQVMKEKIVYNFIPQAFTNAYVRAWQTDKDVYLVIEEINRGNCAQIFGDLFQLLDRDKDGYSKYPIDTDSDLGNHIRKALQKTERNDIPEEVKSGKKMQLPSNLYIWATMNTSDQSLFPIDSAFKRRWDWKYMKIKDMGDKIAQPYQIIIKDKQYSWWGFISKMNEHISSTTSSEDKQLGYFFVNREDGQISADDFVNKVLFYLYNDALKDYSVGLNIKNEQGELKAAKFSDFYDDNGAVIPEKIIEALDDYIPQEAVSANEE